MDTPPCTIPSLTPAFLTPTPPKKTKEYKDDCTLDDALKLAVKVLSKSMDSTTLTVDKVELATVTRDADTGAVVYRMYGVKELQPLLDVVNAEKEKEQEEGA